jgi:hypothetical protein
VQGQILKNFAHLNLSGKKALGPPAPRWLLTLATRYSYRSPRRSQPHRYIETISHRSDAARVAGGRCIGICLGPFTPYGGRNSCRSLLGQPGARSHSWRRAQGQGSLRVALRAVARHPARQLEAIQAIKGMPGGPPHTVPPDLSPRSPLPPGVIEQPHCVFLYVSDRPGPALISSPRRLVQARARLAR